MDSLASAPFQETGFDIQSKPDRAQRFVAAKADLVAALGMWRLCGSLAMLDIKLRYRGSVLGPFWLTLSSGLMIGMMGFLYSALFHRDLHDYFPFIALSIVLWNFLLALVTDACMCFISVESVIRSVRAPLMLYAIRVVLRNLLILAHNVVVVVIVDLALQINPGWVGLLAIPALLLWLVVAVSTVVLLGALCARFRDIPPIVASLMQLAFFVSGVIWQPSQLKDFEWLLAFNPVFSLLEVLRAPLLGHVPSLAITASALIYSGIIITLASLLFARVRGRIAFWV